jgi:hypothetical protein
MISLVCPGSVIVMMPAQLQVQVEMLSSAGWPATCTVAAPGVQGEAVAGMQGCGVSTPSAALVAAATCGLAKLVHKPNGMMFTMGTWSMMVAPGCPLVEIWLLGSTIRDDGDVPKEHANWAPFTVCSGIAVSPTARSLLWSYPISFRTCK